MRIKHLYHTLGGRITSITAIAHDSFRGNVVWQFIGSVDFYDGTSMIGGVISPADVYISHGDAKAKIEYNTVMELLNQYLLCNGSWETETYKWKPKNKSGRKSIDEVGEKSGS